MRRLIAAVAVLYASLTLFAQSNPASHNISAAHAATAKTESTRANGADAAELPVRRVVLYKNGVGYFEHNGKVHGSQELNVRFTTAQLNDVLKSLTVVDLGGGQITGVRYNSIAPLSERLSTLRIPLGEQTTQQETLNALRGSRVEVKTGVAVFVGRLLSVETVTRKDPRSETEYTATLVSVASDSGEIRSFEVGGPASLNSTSVRLLDNELNQELGRYLSLIGSARAKDLRQMTITSNGTGEREVQVSYISEVPVWKSTYRIVLPSDETKKPLLQGWAIIDNTVGEDWKNVQLSLVAGSPQSFIQNISQPIYLRRPEVALPKTAMLTPQTHEGTVEEIDRMAKLETPPAAVGGPAVGPGRAGGIGGGTYKVGGVIGGIAGGVPGGTGFVLKAEPPASAPKSRDKYGALSTNEAVEVNGAMPAVTSAYDSMNNIEAGAQGESAGDLFAYNLKQPITVLKNQSALVPIVQSKVEADKVTLWNQGERFPLRALWLNNTSGLTLDGGTFNIIESDEFAGEGIFQELKPGERRLLSYAADTAVRVKTEQIAPWRPATRIRMAKGLLHITREQRNEITYTVHNSDTTMRSVVIEHPARVGWKFTDATPKPEESTNSYHRFRVKVAPGATEKLKVEEFSPVDSTFYLNNLNDEQVKFITNERGVKPELLDALRKLLAKKDEISNVQSQINTRQQEVSRITQEQSRLRENMKVLKGSSEEKALLQRYVASLNQQEDQLASLNKEINDLNAQSRKLNDELNAMAQSYTMDETL